MKLPHAKKLTAAILTGGLALPAVAHADIAGVWFAAKMDQVSGTGDVYEGFTNSVGYGLEGGVELLGIDLWGEALMMGDDQFMFTVQTGFDLSFGDEVKFTVGLFTGPMFFVFPKQDPESLTLSGAERQALDAAGISQGYSATEIIGQYDQFAEDEAELSRLAVGWNLARLRLNLDYKLAPAVYMGAGAMMGYHYLLSGEDVAAGAKNAAIDDLADEYGLTTELTKLLRDAAGAKEVDRDALDGMNYNVGVYLKFDLNY